MRITGMSAHAARHLYVADDALRDSGARRIQEALGAVEHRNPIPNAADETIQRQTDAIVVLYDRD